MVWLWISPTVHSKYTVHSRSISILSLSSLSVRNHTNGLSYSNLAIYNHHKRELKSKLGYDPIFEPSVFVLGSDPELNYQRNILLDREKFYQYPHLKYNLPFAIAPGLLMVVSGNCLYFNI